MAVVRERRMKKVESVEVVERCIVGIWGWSFEWVVVESVGLNNVWKAECWRVMVRGSVIWNLGLGYILISH